MGKAGKSSIVKFGALGVFGQQESKWSSRELAVALQVVL